MPSRTDWPEPTDRNNDRRRDDRDPARPLGRLVTQFDEDGAPPADGTRGGPVRPPLSAVGGFGGPWPPASRENSMTNGANGAHPQTNGVNGAHPQTNGVNGAHTQTNGVYGVYEPYEPHQDSEDFRADVIRGLTRLSLHWPGRRQLDPNMDDERLAHRAEMTALMNSRETGNTRVHRPARTRVDPPVNANGTNGNGNNGNGTNGNGTNGNGTNGYGTNGYGTNGYGTNGNGRRSDRA